MRLTKVLRPIILALLALAVVDISSANAVEKEEESKPQVLCFVEKCITAVEGTLTGGASTLETLSGLALEGTTGTATLKGIKEGSSSKDGSLTTIDFHITGAHKGEQKCNTEGASAEKGELLFFLEVHHSAGTNAAKELVPLLLAKILNKESKSEVIIKCGVVKNIIKGTIGCALSPGLVAIPTSKEVELRCSLNKTTHDQSTGITCTVLCSENEKDPFEAKFGEKFEDAGMDSVLKGKLNKEAYIDD